MKKSIKYLGHLLYALLVIVAAYFVMALSLSYLSSGSDKTDCSPKHKMYVSSNGVHLFLGIPGSYFQSDFLAKLHLEQAPPYLYFGWGEKTFYLNTPTWNDLTLPVAAKAMLLPSDAAMHVMHFQHARTNWVPVQLCGHQRTSLVNFVIQSFKSSEQSFTQLEPKGYGPNNYFYPARGTYSCFYTSNTWVNEALKEAGVNTAVWTPFDFGVLWHLETNN